MSPVLSATCIADVPGGGLQPALSRTDDGVAAIGASQRNDRNAVAPYEDALDRQHADKIFIEGLAIEHDR